MMINYCGICGPATSAFQKIISEILLCDPIHASERADGQLEPPWEVVKRMRERVKELEVFHGDVRAGCDIKRHGRLYRQVEVATNGLTVDEDQLNECCACLNEANARIKELEAELSASKASNLVFVPAMSDDMAETYMEDNLRLQARVRELEANIAETHDWYCGCGHWNGSNLSVCAQCGRTPLEGRK
ncbi:MAG TPA: hypothetical protein VLH56_02575 [Dissulfurispiraceae bacterium]|nr:hypothetical protein [Dissulfurispiraceae bacterium]